MPICEKEEVSNVWSLPFSMLNLSPAKFLTRKSSGINLNFHIHFIWYKFYIYACIYEHNLGCWTFLPIFYDIFSPLIELLEHILQLIELTHLIYINIIINLVLPSIETLLFLKNYQEWTPLKLIQTHKNNKHITDSNILLIDNMNYFETINCIITFNLIFINWSLISISVNYCRKKQYI